MDVIDLYQVGLLAAQKTSKSLYYRKTEDQKRFAATYALGKLFSRMSFRPKTIDVMSPTDFIKAIGRLNSTFSNTSEQQDAHEFINFIINRIAEEGDDELEQSKKAGKASFAGAWSSKLGDSVAHKAFQGVMATELRCLGCDNTSLHTETFFDISVDIPDNAAQTYTLVELLDKMQEKELLRGEDKLACDKCMCAQEAEKSVRCLRLPRTLIVHLKRFKFSERRGIFLKLQHEVVYPLTLNMSVNSKELGDFPQDKRTYQLQAVIVHIGSTPYGGHYISVVRRFNKWFVYNDERISLVTEDVHKKLYGSKGISGMSSACAYVLIYSEELYSQFCQQLPNLLSQPQKSSSQKTTQNQTEQQQQQQKKKTAAIRKYESKLESELAK